jgi:tRNA (cmo5U34)-methyltransferase
MIDNTIPVSAAEYSNNLRQTTPYFQNFYYEAVDIVKHTQKEVKNWLDTGCGTGNMILEAQQTFRSTRYLLADPSPEMLMHARMHLARIPQHQLMIVGAIGSEELDLTGFPCPQVITASLAHHYLSETDRLKATQQCYEMLADGGVYITLETIKPNTTEGNEVGLKRWISYQISQGRTEEDAREYLEHLGTSCFPITVDAHLALLKEAGFKAAELFWFSHMQAGFFALK